LSLLMCGALFQFVPVLVAQPLHSNMLPLPTLVLLVAGLAALILGFLQLAGQVAPAPPFFAFAAVLLGAGFALVLWNLARTLIAARTRPLPAQFVIVGLASVAATAILGIVFALVLGGSAAYDPFVALTAIGLPLHVIAGLGGWLTFTAMGVSYRLLAMFMLAPELEGASTRTALWTGSGALAVVIVGGVVAIAAGLGPRWALVAGGLLAVAALGLYGRDILQLYRRRKRRVIELNSRMAGVALAHLAATVVLGAVLVASGTLDRHVGALVFLAAFGWLTGLGLAKLYKIVAFLTWLECYGPVLGKVDAPRVQDLVVEPRAARWFWLYFAATDLAVLGLLVDATALARLAAGAMVLASAAIGHELLRIRRLADVRDAGRLREGVTLPRLLVAMVPQA